MKPSILINLLLAFLAFGLFISLIFPFYANFFVQWNEGMKIWFVFGCIIAGLTISLANYFLCKIILLKRLQEISGISNALSQGDLSLACNIKSNNLIGKIIDSFNLMAQNLRKTIGQIGDSPSILESDIAKMSEFFTQTQTSMDLQDQKTL